MRVIFALILLALSIFGSDADATKYAKASANYLFELNKEGLRSTLEPLLLERPDIVSLRVIDKSDGKLFYGYGEIGNDIKNCAKDEHLSIEEILHSGDSMGLLLLCKKETTKRATLTREEEEWVAKNRKITAHNEMDWAPFNYNKDGTPLGFSIDYIKLVTSKVGLEVEFVSGEWNDLLNMVFNKKLDVMLNIAKSKEREVHLIYVGDYAQDSTVVVSRRDNPNIKGIESLFGKKVSVVDGFIDEITLRERYPLIQRVLYKNFSDALKAVEFGEVDATVGKGSIARHIISEELLSGLEFKGELKPLNQDDQKMYIAVRNDAPILASILKKGMDEISQQELYNLRKKWIIQGAAGASLSLSDKQKEWLKVNAPIKMGSTDNWPPFDMLDDGKRHIGVNADFLKLISEILGVKIEPVINPLWDGVISDGKDGKSHGITALPIAPEYEKDFLFTQVYANNPVVIITQDSATFRGLHELKKIITVKGNDFSSELLPEQYKNMSYCDATLECFDAVLKGKAEGYIGWLADAQYMMTQNAIKGLKPTITVQSQQSSLRIGVSKKHPELKEILDKALDQIAQDERNRIMAKWVSGDMGLAKIDFSPQEVAWLAKKPKLKFAVDPQWLPIESINEKSLQYEGMNADLLKKISELTGVGFELVSTKEWPESVALSKEGRVDMLACVSKTPEREGYLNFSNQTIELTDGVLMRSDASFIDEIDDLKGLKVGVPDGTSVHAKLQKEHPLLILMPIKGTEKALNMLSDGVIDAYIGNLEVSGYTLQQLGFFNLKVVLKLPEKRYMHIALQKSAPPEALSVLNKAIFTISEHEMQTIRQRWVGLKVTDEMDYELLAKVGAGILFLIAFILYNNHKLKKLVAVRTKDLQEQKDELAIFNENLEKIVRERTRALEKAKDEVEELHKMTKDSIEYASLIQHAIVPNNKIFNEYFDDYFAIWHPRDVVGGDLYLFDELNDNECLIMLVDCTGHGVPGAFVTMLVKAIERQMIGGLIRGEVESDPAKILSIFNKSMKQLLRQDGDSESVSNAGFDGAILHYNKAKKELKYAGANTPLFYIQNGVLNTLKGDRHSVGYTKSDANFEFTCHTIDTHKTTTLFLSTDGLFDQLGGEKSLPFGKKRFVEILEKYQNQSFTDMQDMIIYALKNYQGDNERQDDVTILGMRIG